MRWESSRILRGDFQEAISQLERAPTIGPETIDLLVHFLMANVHLSQKDWDKSAEHFQKATGFIPRFSTENIDIKKHFNKAVPASSAQINLATLYLFQGWQDKGEEACDLALKYHKSNFIASYIKGKALMQKRELDQAIAPFQQANKLGSQFGAANYELAELYVVQKSLTRAISEYKRVIELDPTDPAVRLKLGAVYDLEGKAEGALREYEQVITLAPDSAIGYNQLAYFYAGKEGNLDEALTLAHNAVEHAPNNGAILDTLGWVLFKRGDYKAAVKKLTSAIQRIPNSSTIRYHIGQAYLKGGNAESALNEFRNALRISQQFPEVDETKAMIQQIEAQ